MKIRINEEGFFRGQFPDEFITDNWNNIINGDLISEWILIDAELPGENLIKPKRESFKWTEGASAQEIALLNQSKIDNISAFYREEINKIVLPYLPDYSVFHVEFPQEILDKWAVLKAECIAKIKEIDPNQTMGKPSKTNYK